jgi:hypothetical protein
VRACAGATGLQNPLALALLQGDFGPGDTVRVAYRDGAFEFERVTPEPAAA